MTPVPEIRGGSPSLEDGVEGLDCKTKKRQKDAERESIEGGWDTCLSRLQSKIAYARRGASE